jgi:ribonuclease R
MKKTRGATKSGRGPALTDWRKSDPHAEVEAGRYRQPLPSRGFIIDALSRESAPLTAVELIERFGLGPDDAIDGFRARLNAMVRDGQLAQNRRGAYGPVKDMNLIAGRVIAHRDGFGFMTPDEGGDDLFLPPNQMQQLWPGDHILARVAGTDRRGRSEGVVVEILSRGVRQVVGRYKVEHGVHLVVPDHPRIRHEVLIPPDDRGDAEPGQMVVAEIVTDPQARSLAVGRITEVLGDHLGPGMEIEAAIRAHGIPHRFPDAALADAERMPDHVREQDIEGRVDLRDMPLVTIDGADARDFDDAVHVRATRNGWRLWVAIADVSAYVQPDSALDEEARARGNSVYFPDHVVPMLPEKLSNGLCSLNPHVDRLCMVCEMGISREGEITRARFYEAVMRSQARFTYDEVYAMLEGKAGTLPAAHKALLPHLLELDRLYGALSAARAARGAVEFESQETRIVFGEDRKIERIVPMHRNRAHVIIEECMIAANVAAARFVQKHKRPALYRVHQPPDASKVLALREFLATRGLQLGGGATPESMDYRRVSQLAASREDAGVIQTMLLRSMMQARYSPDCAGHFGLALEEYAHFTSPIRRYPDLLLHRAIKHALSGESRKRYRYDDAELDALGVQCSATDRRADDATRDVQLWLKCEYMRQHIGDTFRGTISGVAAFGIFVSLDSLYVEGMVHVSSLFNDYYDHDPSRARLVGRKNGRVFALGDSVEVRVVRVSLDERKIDLEPAEGPVADGVQTKLTSRKDHQQGSKAPGTPAKGRRKRRGKQS